jgi:hypothetical protein
MQTETLLRVQRSYPTRVKVFRSMSSYLEQIGWSYRHETESYFPPLVLFYDQGQIPVLLLPVPPLRSR